jgi:hypothetical protein
MAKNYIPSPDYLTSMYSNPQFGGRWVVVRKIPINKIKIDKSLFSFQNEVSLRQVEGMVKEFTEGGWYPVMVNSDYFLLDGQHRLATAKKMKLKYIDVVVDNGDMPSVPHRSKRKHNIFNYKIPTSALTTRNL